MRWWSRLISTRKADVFIPPTMPTHEQIRDAEDKLGITFPSTYLAFLRKRDPVPLGLCAKFYWIGAESPDCENIVEANGRLRKEGIPAYLVAFFNDGMGNLVCFDSRKTTANGESPIFFWDHELPAEANIEATERDAENRESCGIVAKAFSKWLESELASHR